jgi:hypothetical protein
MLEALMLTPNERFSKHPELGQSDVLRNLADKLPQAKFIMYVHEEGILQTPHYHFFIQFTPKSKVTFRQLNNWFHNSVWLAYPKGTPKQNFTYFAKDKDPNEVIILGDKILLEQDTKQ